MYVVCMVNAPRPLFYPVLACVLVAGVAAFAVDAKEPAWALRSTWVYRAEVGASLTGLLYLPLVALSLAWRGQTFRRIQGPAGTALETPADDIDAAAQEFSRYKAQNDKQLELLDTAVANLNERVEGLEETASGDDAERSRG
jgi:hypothetical protein